VATRGAPMPLTSHQASIARLLATNRTPDSYLAGGAALHIEPNSKRYSNDLDYFQDSEARVLSAFTEDRRLLEGAGYGVTVLMNQPGFIRAIVEKGADQTKVEWAHDSAWRFLPPVLHEISGYQLHPVDLAINKLLALVGRDEARDFLDILHAHDTILPLGALCWAAAGKDPGFTPFLLLSLLQRRGRYHAEDFKRLALRDPVDLVALKAQWLRALDEANTFVHARPPDELGCLYYSRSRQRFLGDFDPADVGRDVVVHFGRPGGVLPRIG
jgi:hypothetical protein